MPAIWLVRSEDMKRLRTLLQLGRNAVRYRASKLTGWPCPVEAVSLEVTRRCIARCVMCNIWKTPSSTEDLPIATWVNLLRSRALRSLREVDITGGEPFLRRDLPTLVTAIADGKSELFPELKTVAITTNGFLTGRLLRMTQDMARTLQQAHIELVLAVAMDGIGEAHERIRGVKGSWPKLDRTIDGLVRLRAEFPNVVVGIKMTILPTNIDELESVTQYAGARGLFTIVSPCILTEVRYANRDRAVDLRFSERDREQLKSFYSRDASGWSYHRKVLLDYVIAGHVHKPCTAGFNYFFIRSTGDVYPCPLINHPIGNITDEPLESLLRSPRAARFRKDIGTYRECGSCTEPGLERYALPFEGMTYAGLLLRMSSKEADEMHRHLGLDKYFD